MLKKITLNIINSPTMMTWANLLSKTIGLALLLPLVLSKFSENDIVLWYVLTTMVGIGLLFDLGFTPTFVRFIAYAKSGVTIEQLCDITNKAEAIKKKTSNEDGLQAIFKIINKNYFVISILTFSILLSLGSFFVAGPISESTNPIDGWFSWIIVSSTTAFLLFGNKYVAILHGMKKIADNQRAMMVTSILATLIAALALMFDASLLLVISLYQGISSCSVFLNKRLANKYLFITGKRDEKTLSSINDKEVTKLRRIIFSSAWKSAVGILMSVGLIHLSGIAAANYLTTADAAMYLLSLQLIRAISSFSQAPFYTKIPDLAGYYAKKNIVNLREISFVAESKSLIFFVLSCLVVGCLFPYADSFFDFNASLPNELLWLLLSLGILVERSGAMHIQIYSLTNNIIWHYVNGITGLVMIALFLFFIGNQGVIAFPLSLLIAYSLFYFPISTYFAAKVVGNNYVFRQSALLVIGSLSLVILLSV
jgi:hypothetical protein